MPANKKTPAPVVPAAPTEDDAPSFEQALERLETIVEELEGGSLSLEVSLARYEEGVRLSRRLTQTLDQAEKRIERLVEENGQPPTTRSVEDDPAASHRAIGAGEGDPGTSRRATRAGEGDPGTSQRETRAGEGDEGELPF